MINGYTEKFILIFIEQMKMLVGILNGIGQKLVSLLNMEKDNIMIGTVIVFMHLIKEGSK